MFVHCSFRTQSGVAERLRKATKLLYDFTKTTEGEGNGFSNTLPELVISDFDDEQVWQEIELQNEPCIDSFVPKLASLVGHSDHLSFKTHDEGEKYDENHTERTGEGESEDEEGDRSDQSVSEDDDSGLDQDSDEGDLSEEEIQMKRLLDQIDQPDREHGAKSDEDSSDSEESNLDFDFGSSSLTGKSEKTTADRSKHKSDNRNSNNKNKRKTVVDDRFFRLADMEEFLEQEDAKEERKIARERGLKPDEEEESSDEDIDVFAEIPQEEEEEEVKPTRFTKN